MNSDEKQDIEFKLKHLDTLIWQIQKIFNQIKQKKGVDQKRLQDGLNNMVMLRNIAYDIHQMHRMEDLQKREIYFMQRDYLKNHALEVFMGQINIHWYVKTLDIVVDTLLQIRKANMNNIYMIYVLLQKIKILSVIYQYAVTFNQEDIFYQNSHPSWDQIRMFTQRIELCPPAEMQKQIKNQRKMLETGMVLGKIHAKCKNKVGSSIKLLYHGISSMVSEKKRVNSTYSFRADMNIEKIRCMLNFAQSGFVNLLMNTTLPSIEYLDKIYLSDSAYPRLTIDSVVEWSEGKVSKFRLRQPIVNEQINLNNLFKENKGKICIRVMCSQRLERKYVYTTESPQDYQTIIFHIHGGGFVGMTSKSHQCYTRQWAKKCGAPIFSIDYRKAPQYPYPIGLNDCWQAYNWLLYESHKYFNIRSNKRIIVAGDSAGGNLTLSLTTMCIEHKVQLPFALMPSYPAVNISMKVFTPSFIISLTDPILTFDFLLFCTKSYVSDQRIIPEKDYLVCPIYIPDHILERFPPTYMFLAESDPLHNDAMRLALRLQQMCQQCSKNTGRVSVIQYENMIHGYLQHELMMPSAKICVRHSIQVLSQLVSAL